MAKYPDLKSYLQANFKDLFTKEVQKFVDSNYDGSGFHSINVVSLLKHKIENLEVKALTCHDAPGSIVKMDVGVAADIVDLGLGRKSYEADRNRRWFTVYLQGLLRDGLQNVEVLDVKEFHNGKFQKENALDQFLIPYIYSSMLEEIADDFTEFYCANAVYKGYALPVNHILQELEIGFILADLPTDCLGRMYFKSGKAVVYHKQPQFHESWETEQEIPAGTMLINRNRYFLGGEGTYLLTIAHEIIHWHLHQKYFKLLSLLDDESKMMSCEVEPSNYQESMTMAQKAHWFAEWQANALAMRIAMPRELMIQAFEEAKYSAKPFHFSGDYVEDILQRVAALFDVPVFIAKQRARQLGFDRADGAFVHVDGKRYEPFYFKEGTLESHQTFIIDRAGYEKLYENDVAFKQLIDSGEFIYIGYVVSINDPKYISVEFMGDKAEFKLSDYAREHADECCIIFSYHGSTSLNGIKDKYEFYGEAYLSKEVKSEGLVDYGYDEKGNLLCFKSLSEIVKKRKEQEDEAQKTFLKMQLKNCDTFGKKLKFFMKEVVNVTVEELAHRLQCSDTTIKKYRSSYIPPVETVVAICIVMRLNIIYSRYLLKACNCTLEENDLVGRAYIACLEFSNGDLEQCNQILDYYGVDHILKQKNGKRRRKLLMRE